MNCLLWEESTVKENLIDQIQTLHQNVQSETVQFAPTVHCDCVEFPALGQFSMVVTGNILMAWTDNLGILSQHVTCVLD